MNFKLTKWKLIVSILVILLISSARFYSSDFNDSNLGITVGPSIFIYLIWSLFEKKK